MYGECCVIFVIFLHFERTCFAVLRRETSEKQFLLEVLEKTSLRSTSDYLAFDYVIEINVNVEHNCGNYI